MKYSRVGLALLTAAALLAGVLPPKALADSNARIVRLSYVDGDTQIDSRDGRGFAQAFLNMPLAPGTQVLTRADGRAEIEFEDMSTVRLAPDTLVQTQALDLRSSGAKSTLVDLQDGTAYFDVRKADDANDFRVSTGRREFSPTRASRFRLRVDHKQVVLAVFKGEVEVIGEGGRLTVRKDETLTLDLDDPARYFLAKGISSGPEDDWNQERADYRERYANAGNYTGYSSAYSYGVSDLNYWGSYSYIAGYGYMWRPNYYGLDWNPYANGAWYWYPGYGWIWVSAYPWGWMPFRYGSWYYISGHGWCWHPGSHWNHWRPVVAVHNPPPGHRAPAPPPPTGRHDPVIVGHGPSTILPPGDPGPGHLRGVRDADLPNRRGGNPAGGRGSTGAGPSSSGAGVTPAGGSTVNAGSGSGGSVGPGGSNQPAAGSGGHPSGHGREVDLEDAIHNARERRLNGGQPGGVVTNSGAGSAGSPGGSTSSGGPGASPGPSPASGREKIPEPRRQLSPTITNDSPTPEAGASGSATSSGSGGGNVSPNAGAIPPAAAPAPSSTPDRSWEPSRDLPRERLMPGSGSPSSVPSSAGSSTSGPSRPSPGWSGGRSAGTGSGSSSGGSSIHSSPPSSSGSGGGRSSGAGAGSSSGGSRSIGSSPSASGGRSSSPSSSKGSTSSTPK